MDAKVEALRTAMSDMGTAMGGKVNISGLDQAAVSQTQQIAERLRNEVQQHVTRLHQRIDEVDATEKFRRGTLQQQEQQLSIVIAGIQSQRTEWEILRSDVRKLLTSEATTAVEIRNLKDRFDILEAKKAELAEKFAGIRAEVDALLRERN